MPFDPSQPSTIESGTSEQKAAKFDPSKPSELVASEPEQAATPPAPKFPQDDPKYEYGNILPFAKNKETGAVSLAAPEMMRQPARGFVDLSHRLEGPLTPEKMRGLNPDEQAAFMAAGGMRMSPLNVASTTTAKAMAQVAHDAGYVLPPIEATAEPSMLSKVLSSPAGKIKTQQLASETNQEVTNGLAAEGMKVPKDTVLTDKVFRDVRAREGKTYDEVVSAVPEVDLARDPQFSARAAQVGKPSAETERLFPSTTEPPGVKALRSEMVAHARGGTKAVMNYIADLRFNSNKNFQTIGDAMAHRMGAAQREAANVLEDALENSVQNAPRYYQEKLDEAVARRAEATADFNYANTSKGYLPVSDIGKKVEAARSAVQEANADVARWEGRLKNAENRNETNQTLVDRFRQARRMMAKSYDLEGVTNTTTGDVNAAGLAKLSAAGRPLSDQLKTIADVASAFPKDVQNPARFGGAEPWSGLDFFGAVGAAAAGHPGAAAGVIARPFVRSTILSGPYQRNMLAPKVQSGIPPRIRALLSPAIPPGAANAVGGLQSWMPTEEDQSAAVLSGTP